MPCYYPNRAYQTENGSIVFTELKRNGPIVKTLSLPCGQCHGCRLERSRQWAMRCVHETNLYKRNCFITLTYDEEHLPERGRLNYNDYQLFMKRLRKLAEPEIVRFYMCGEYGGQTGRPHYHAILFNWDWDDKKFFKTTGSGEKIYTSKTLEKLWPWGHSSSAAATFESAAYIARYCMQKITGEAAEEHYKRYDHLGEYQLVPEFNEMSTRPGIGADWLNFYRKDVYTHDYVIINGHESRAPKYYDKLQKRYDAYGMDDLKSIREYRAYTHAEDNTPERLAVKEQVAKAKINQLKRDAL